MTPFLDIMVVPSYGRDACLVRWTLASGFEGARIYVYRSEDGQTGWTLLNPDTPITDRAYFEDTTFVVRDLLTTTHYRLLLEHQGREFDSPIVGAFDKLTRKEFGIVRRIMQLELKSLREGRQGIEVMVFSPKTRGPACRCVDPVTKQSSQASLCPYCYGTRIDGGFHPPVKTWIKAMQWNPNSKDDEPSGRARVDRNAVVTRALAIPALNTDDIIVHPVTDNRLSVVATKVEYFRGTVPVVCAPSLVLLPRQDIRYKLPLP